MCADGFPNLNSLLLGYLILNFLFASIKLITNSKNPSSNPLKMLWSSTFDPKNAYRSPPVVLKFNTGSRLGHVRTSTRIFPPSNKVRTLDKIDHWQGGIKYRNYDAAFETILRLTGANKILLPAQGHKVRFNFYRASKILLVTGSN